jgi:peptidoglycan/xylan/chitin deacetylase (PgdA/CDA1 family)
VINPLKTEIKEDPYANDGLSFRALCYHDARDNLRDSFQTWPERGALETSTLIDQFEWLRENGYHMVSLADIVAARNGGPKLPSKPILLTFDDGYLSMYTRIFPLLKLFNYPAVIGLVGEWLTENQEGKVFYGDRWIPRENFVTWSQVREMMASGLVEVASHSHSLHKGARSNPQGSLPSSAITRIYHPQDRHYENDAEYVRRIRSDLAKNSTLIFNNTGTKPRAMIWPYGAYNLLAVRAAEAEGMPISMTLEPGTNTPDHPLNRIRRDMLFFNDKVSDLKRDLRQQARYDGEAQPLSRIIGVDLDTLYDPDPAKQELKLGNLIERIYRLRVNTIYLRAVSDLDHDGLAEVAYFPNRHLPVRADLFNRVVWQLQTRATAGSTALYVYAWLPLTAYKLPSGQSVNNQVIKEIYDDAGKNAPRIGGLVIGIDTEVNSKDAVNTQLLIRELKDVFKAHQPYAFIARLLPYSTLQEVKDRRPYISNLIKEYDFVTLTLTASDEDSTITTKSLADSVGSIRLMTDSIDSAAFLLSTDQGKGNISAELLADQLKILQQNGVRNFGYYPDHAAFDYPALSVIRPAISLHTNPGI